MDIQNTIMRNGKLECNVSSRDELLMLDRKFREAFLDNKIPITKIIGFYLEDGEKSRNYAIRRSSNCLTNPIEISKNLSKVVVENTDAIVCRTKRLIGDVYSDNIKFIHAGKEIGLLTKNQYLFTLLKPSSLCVFLNKETGFKRIEDNVDIMKNKWKDMFEIETDKYYPLNTLHSVAEDIFILPCDGKEIRYRLRNSEDDEIFSQLWEEYKMKG